MNLLTKIMLTVGIVMGFFFILGYIIIYSKNGGGATSGFFGVILVFVSIVVLKAIWKKTNANNNTYSK